MEKILYLFGSGSTQISIKEPKKDFPVERTVQVSDQNDREFVLGQRTIRLVRSDRFVVIHRDNLNRGFFGAAHVEHVLLGQFEQSADQEVERFSLEHQVTESHFVESMMTRRTK